MFHFLWTFARYPTHSNLYIKNAPICPISSRKIHSTLPSNSGLPPVFDVVPIFGCNVLFRVQIPNFALSIEKSGHGTFPMVCISACGILSKFFRKTSDNLLFSILKMEFSQNLSFFIMKFQGNLTERVWPVVTSLCLTLPCVLTTVYLLLWQTYVLKIELIIYSIQLVLYALETGFALMAIATFARA